MDYRGLRAFALATPNMGELNQLLGALKAVSDITAGAEATGFISTRLCVMTV